MDGTVQAVRSYGHLPFGETWYESGIASKWKFTTYERTDESLPDYAMFRHYSSRYGRFMQVDPVPGIIGIPASVNGNAYVGNDPINATDPLGLFMRCTEGYHPIFDGAGLGIGCEADSDGSNNGGGGGGGRIYNRMAQPVSLEGGGGGTKPDKGELIRRLISNKNCADLFGGLSNALHAIAQTEYVDVNSVPPVNVEGDVVNNFASDPGLIAWSVTYYSGTQVPTPRAFIAITYYRGGDSRFSPVVQLHEGRHVVGYGKEIDAPWDKSGTDGKYTLEYLTIKVLCPESPVPTVSSDVPNEIQ